MRLFQRSPLPILCAAAAIGLLALTADPAIAGKKHGASASIMHQQLPLNSHAPATSGYALSIALQSTRPTEHRDRQHVPPCPTMRVESSIPCIGAIMIDAAKWAPF